MLRVYVSDFIQKLRMVPFHNFIVGIDECDDIGTQHEINLNSLFHGFLANAEDTFTLTDFLYLHEYYDSHPQHMV